MCGLGAAANYVDRHAPAFFTFTPHGMFPRVEDRQRLDWELELIGCSKSIDTKAYTAQESSPILQIQGPPDQSIGSVHVHLLLAGTSHRDDKLFFTYAGILHSASIAIK
jgi:hypothetical protein